jgi:hypothetical protein
MQQPMGARRGRYDGELVATLRIAAMMTCVTSILTTDVAVKITHPTSA